MTLKTIHIPPNFTDVHRVAEHQTIRVFLNTPGGTLLNDHMTGSTVPGDNLAVCGSVVPPMAAKTPR